MPYVCNFAGALKQLGKSVSSNDCVKILTELDTDGDGEIDFKYTNLNIYLPSSEFVKGIGTHFLASEFSSAIPELSNEQVSIHLQTHV